MDELSVTMVTQGHAQEKDCKKEKAGGTSTGLTLKETHEVAVKLRLVVPDYASHLQKDQAHYRIMTVNKRCVLCQIWTNILALQ